VGVNIFNHSPLPRGVSAPSRQGVQKPYSSLSANYLHHLNLENSDAAKQYII